MCGCGGVGGCWVLLETIFCRSLKLCIWSDSEPTKLLSHTRRRGPQSDKHLPQSPFTCQFFRLRHLALLSISLIFLRFYCLEAQKWLIRFTCLSSNCSDAAICAFLFKFTSRIYTSRLLVPFSPMMCCTERLPASSSPSSSCTSIARRRFLGRWSSLHSRGGRHKDNFDENIRLLAARYSQLWFFSRSWIHSTVIVPKV